MAETHPLDRLHAAILARKGANPEESYTARLLGRGMMQCAKKLGEEAVETALAAVSGDREDITAESADLLYHLAVVWAASGVTPEDVYAELAARETRSGIAEKQSRKK